MNFLNRLSGHPIKSDLSVLYTRYAILDGGSSKCIATPDAPKNFLIKIAINMYYNLLSLSSHFFLFAFDSEELFWLL